MNGDYLLDTNIVIALFAEEQLVLDKIGQANSIFIPAIVIGELYYGAYNSSKKEENEAKIDVFVISSNILDYEQFVAKIYGKIKKLLKDKGKPIPENDIWIAALAMQYDLTLVSRDAHFGHIDGLKWDKW